MAIQMASESERSLTIFMIHFAVEVNSYWTDTLQMIESKESQNTPSPSKDPVHGRDNTVQSGGKAGNHGPNKRREQILWNTLKLVGTQKCH